MKLTAKRQLFMAFGIVFGLFGLFAQNNGDLELGANFGFSQTGVIAPGEETTGERLVFNVGVSSEYYFSDRFGLKLKLISDNKGYSKGTIKDINYNVYTTDIELNYITIPLMFNLHFSKHRRWYLGFGPYFGVLTNAKDSKFQVDIRDQINSLDYGLAFSLGYKFKINDNIKLFIEEDGQYGIKNIISGENEYLVWNTRGAYNFGVLINF